jgi:outer membrane receptor protein involved in Fe transport
LAFAVFLVALPLCVVADERIDEIVVTADFRGRSIDDLATSVTVIDSTAIREMAIQHFEELIHLVPNLNWSGDGHRARYFQIRGVGELEQYQGAPNPSIGFLIDDIDFSGIGTVATVFDMESVEVLRGSQGSRYGANALGGLIYLRSTSPSAERDGRVTVTAAGDDTLSVGAAFGGAMNATETLTFRMSAQLYESDGFRRNTSLNRDDTNRRDETSVRLRVRFEPTDQFAANLAVMYTDIDDGYDAFALDNSFTVLSDNPGQDAQESIGASLRLDWSEIGGFSLTSITTLADTGIDFGFDADWGSTDSWLPFTYDFVSQSVRQRKTVSQEFRAVSERWLVGVYALRLTEDSREFSSGIYIDPFSGFSDSLDSVFDSNYAANSVALFGQFDHSFSNTTRLSAGLRFERRIASYSDSNALSFAPTETLWGGELSFKHELGRSTHVYATVSRGYKAGGFNLGPTPPGKQDFGDEIMWSIEAGVKSHLLDDALRVSASIFKNRRDHQQVRSSSQLVANDPASFVFFTDNIGTGKTLGIETELRWFATESWQFYTSIGLLDAIFDDGREQAHAPTYSFAGGALFNHSSGLFAAVDVTAKDEFFFDVSHDQRSQAFAMLNARFGFESEKWRGSLWMRNVFDEEYAVRGFFFGNEPPNFPNTLYTRLGDPRQLGVTLERRF